MTGQSIKRVAGVAALMTGIAAISACAPAVVEAPVKVVDRPVPRPYPPTGAAPNLVTPPLDINGNRVTVNNGVTGAQALWNLRSAYNVAALNCSSPDHVTLVSSYGDFLKNNERSLRDANRKLDVQFKDMHGAKYIREREAYQTQVYNYFALPPVLPTFCDEMVALGQELAAVPASDLEAFAVPGLARIESIYVDFFNRYDAYRTGFAQWQLDYEAKYGILPPQGYFLPGETRVQAATVPPSVAAPAEISPAGT